MTIKEAYERFSVPPNLIKHMLTVAGVVLFIKDHWTGIYLDWAAIEKAALLHDVGNIIKFDLDKYEKFLEGEKSKVDHWKEVQKQTIDKYGNDEHKATKKMLIEMGVDEKIIEIILKKSFGNSMQIVNSTDWYPKVLFYADLRVLPGGVSTMNERFKDIKERMPQYTSRLDFEKLLSACKKIENQIQDNLNVSVSEINSESTIKDNERFLNTNI